MDIIASIYDTRAAASAKRRFMRFTKTASVHDLRDPLDTRKARAERYARKNKTDGRKAVFL